MSTKPKRSASLAANRRLFSQDLGGQTSIRPVRAVTPLLPRNPLFRQLSRTAELRTLTFLPRLQYWRCYYSNTAAVIFVIDSTDIDRLGTAAEELAAMLSEEELQDAALLVFANKQDQPGAKGAGEISEALKLAELRDRNWSIVACSAIDGRGVDEGMDWLTVSFLLSFWGSGAARELVLTREMPRRQRFRQTIHRRGVFFFILSMREGEVEINIQFDSTIPHPFCI